VLSSHLPALQSPLALCSPLSAPLHTPVPTLATSIPYNQQRQFNEQDFIHHGLSKNKFSHTCARFGYFDLSKWGNSQNCLIFDVIFEAASYLSKKLQLLKISENSLHQETSETFSLPEISKNSVIPFMKWARSEGVRIPRKALQEASYGGSEVVEWLVEEVEKSIERIKLQWREEEGARSRGDEEERGGTRKRNKEEEEEEQGRRAEEYKEAGKEEGSEDEEVDEVEGYKVSGKGRWKNEGWEGGRVGVSIKNYQESILLGASSGAHLEILLWAKERGLLCRSQIFYSNYVQILEWLKEEGCLWSSTGRRKRRGRRRKGIKRE
jgi:hypothetical protein